MPQDINTVYHDFISSYPADKRDILITNKTLILQTILANLDIKAKALYSELELLIIANELRLKVYTVGSRLADPIDHSDQLESPVSLEINAKNVAKHLILSTPAGKDGADILESPLLHSDNINAVFKKRNLPAMAALRKEFQNFLSQMSKPALESVIHDESDEKQLTTFVHNFLGLYPILEPETGETLTLPIKTAINQWEAIDFQFERIDISPQSGLIAHLLTAEEDRMYAYALVPVHRTKISPYLLFPGTTFDVGQGVRLARISNITPKCSSGESHDMTLVTQWFSQQTQKVITAGQSQGGVLAMLTAAKYPHQVSAAHCLNPTALSKHTLGRLLPSWCAISEDKRPAIFIYTQHQDPIFDLEKGFLPGKNTHLYLLIPDSDKLSVNASFASLVPSIVPTKLLHKITTILARAYQAHGHLYAGHRQLIMIELNLARENTRFYREITSNAKLMVSNLFFSAQKASLLVHLCEKKYGLNTIHKLGGFSLCMLLLGNLIHESLKNPRLAKGALLFLAFYSLLLPHIEGEISYRMASFRA